MNFNRDNSTPIRFTPGREDKFSTDNSEVGTRPTGDPKSAKSFQKVLRKGSEDKDKGEGETTAAIDEEEGEQSAMTLAEEQALKKKQAPTSLFELSSHASKSSSMAHEIKNAATTDHAEKKFTLDSKSDALAKNDRITEGASESPSELYAKMTAREPKKFDAHTTDQATNLSAIPVKEEKKEFNSRFSTEQPDLSYVNPLALNTQPVQSTNITTEKTVLSPVNVQDIIDQLVEKVVQMETDGRTDTVITLKRPPILAGADLVVTGFDSAKGEFNITFQKLSQAAKALLDMRVNQESLLLALEQKGYAVHIVTTTTLTEMHLPPTGASTPQDRNRNPDQPKQQQQPGKQK